MIRGRDSASSVYHEAVLIALVTWTAHTEVRSDTMRYRRGLRRWYRKVVGEGLLWGVIYDNPYQRWACGPGSGKCYYGELPKIPASAIL